ncbi:MAG: hypothetical protein IKR13_00050, partial [Victivallales bacterium]|nr:hypothetical protein [Victivallales bacterium]
LAEWQDAVGEALHSSGQSPFPQDLGWARAVAAERRLWIFPRDDAPDTATLAGVEGELTRTHAGEVRRLSEDIWRLSGLKELAKTQSPLEMEFVVPPNYDNCPRIQNDRMSLLPTQAELIHGKATSSATTAEGRLGAAGEELVGSGHSVLTDNGALCDWQNPADRCVWHIRLEAGRYRLRLVTRNGAHSQPWHGDRTVELTLGDHHIEANLTATEELDDSPYYHAAVTDLGKISIDQPREIDLSICTLRLTAPEAATMQLERVELYKT